ncbi:unnamed protein product [Symbiodinium sp. KB8]|nr:unnamed protein product [Symbiodinium sp. KB8]
MLIPATWLRAGPHHLGKDLVLEKGGWPLRSAYGRTRQQRLDGGTNGGRGGVLLSCSGGLAGYVSHHLLQCSVQRRGARRRCSCSQGNPMFCDHCRLH